MSSNAALRQRGGKRGATDAETTPSVDADEIISQFKGAAKETVQREWDYKLALAVITVLAFITRFWGISHPNQVVFDEVHFGKVRNLIVSIEVLVRYGLTKRIAVRILLPSTHLLLRCPPSLWQAPLRIRRLARWIRWLLPIRKHRRLLHHKQGPLRRIQIDARNDGIAYSQRCLLDHVGVWLQPSRLYRCGFRGPL